VELVCRRLNELTEGFSRLVAGMPKVAGRGTGCEQLFVQLRPLALDLGREVFLIGAQRIGGRYKGCALLAQAFLDRKNLLGNP
jgi:hypothetical protein